MVLACAHFQTEMIQNLNLATVLLPKNSNCNRCISCWPLSGSISDLAQLLPIVSGLFFPFEKPKCQLCIAFLATALVKDCKL